MSQRSKRDVRAWRCPKCGTVSYFLRGEKSRCDYTALHNRVRAAGEGRHMSGAAGWIVLALGLAWTLVCIVLACETDP